MLAARRAGITKILIPRHNEKDLIELPAEVKAEVTFHTIDTLDDVLDHLFPPARAKAKPAPSRPAPKGLAPRLEPARKPALPARDKPPAKSARRTGPA